MMPIDDDNFLGGKYRLRRCDRFSAAQKPPPPPKTVENLIFLPPPKMKGATKILNQTRPQKNSKTGPNFRKNSANFWWWVSWCSFSHRETTRHQNFHEERHQNFERSEARKNSKNGARLAGKIWKNRDQFLEDILVVLFFGGVFGVSYFRSSRLLSFPLLSLFSPFLSLSFSFLSYVTIYFCAVVA